MKKYCCELVGTFFLVFAGTGAIIANDIFVGSIGHVGISLTFGLIVMSVIYSFGDSSGAHINPAVSIGFWFANKLSLKDTVYYVIFQCAGAILASLLLKLIFHSHSTLGATIPAIGVLGSFIYEFLLTLLLMLVILSVSTGGKEKGLMAGIAVGGTVALEALFSGPITGASMNPARSLGPALMSWQLTHLWIYIFATTLGALCAVPLCKQLHTTECCPD